MLIWSNMAYRPTARARLEAALAATPHRLVWSAQLQDNLHGSAVADPALRTADIALGQPDPAQLLAAKKLRWIEITTAGYTRYDRPEFWDALRARGTAFTNSSSVFADPCAQHALAMMLGLARQLLPCVTDQARRHWNYEERRYACRVLTGSTVLLLGYGAIARRLAELLAPFHVTLYATRRRAYSERGVRVIAVDELTRVLPLADHIVNLLPANDATAGFVNARRLACCRRGAFFYNIGRGVTVDQRALVDALRDGRLAGAYLDVTDPEPPPAGDALWDAPNLHLTPHIAGGMHDQDDQLVSHFLANLAALDRGEPLTDRVDGIGSEAVEE